METKVLKDNKVFAFPHVIETKDERLIGILTKIRIDDIVYVKGPISVSRSIIAGELIVPAFPAEANQDKASEAEQKKKIIITIIPDSSSHLPLDCLN